METKKTIAEEEIAHFTNAVEKAAGRPIYIYDRIQFKIKGEGRSKEEFLVPYFSKASEAKTLGELTAVLQDGVVALRGVGIYKNIVVNVEDMPSHLVNSYKNHCRVVVELEEKKWYTAALGGYMTEDVPEFKAEGALRNLGGRGETAFGRVSTTSDWLKSFTFTLGLMKPLYFPAINRNAVLHVSAHNSIFDSMAFSNYSQKVVGGNVRLDFMPHSFSYEGSVRDTTLDPTASAELQADAGRSIKSAIRYSFSRDYRDNMAFPTRGQAYHFSSELAGLGGDVKFVKNEFSFNHNFPLSKNGIAFNYILKGGIVAPLASFYNSPATTDAAAVAAVDPYHIRVCDRFFLGGLGTTLNLRGFKPRGIDTGNARESHGGDMYYTTAAHLTFPIPFFTHINFVRGHVFANAGNLVRIKQGNYTEAANELKDKARSAVGGGIIFTTPFGGRFEFNYCHPLRAFPGDKLANGYQFGITFTI